RSLSLFPERDSRIAAVAAQRHASVDPSPCTRLRFDQAFTLDQVQPLPHADQSEPVTSHGDLWIETDALVGDVESQLIASAAERHGHATYCGVSDGIAQRLL